MRKILYETGNESLSLKKGNTNCLTCGHVKVKQMSLSEQFISKDALMFTENIKSIP
jgi:hypothetical protein